MKFKRFHDNRTDVNVTLDGTTEMKVEGDEKVLSIIETKMQNASKTFNRNFTQALYTSQGTKAIVPLSTALATTGTYGEINKSTYSWWRGQVNTTGGAFSMSMLQDTYGDCSDGPLQPDLIITTQSIYNKIWTRVQPQQRGNLENTPAMAKVGFSGISFNKATVVVDKYCPTGYIFVLNTDFWKMSVHRKRNMYWTEKKTPINQDAWVRQLLWMGALICTAPRLSSSRRRFYSIGSTEKSGELLETPNVKVEDNQQPSHAKVIDLVAWKVQRLGIEDTPTDNIPTSARHESDDIVRAA